MRVPILFRRASLLAFASLFTLAVSAAAQNPCAASPCIFQNPKASPEARAQDIVSRMTLEEKVSQTLNHAAAIPRLGVPEYNWWNEALHGVARNGIATVFPESTGLAATWDAPLIHAVSDVISTEARAKSNDALAHNDRRGYTGLTFWSPNINILRDPRWGRGMETYGEDPFLTETIGVAFIRGLQGDDPHYFKVIATPKHFAVHSGPEPLRHEFNVDVSPYDLEDTYMPAFRGAITEGKADSIMCAYNAVDGLPACASPMLLDDHLRKAWGFRGYVVSDCDAVGDITNGHHAAPDKVHAAAMALAAGTDLDCGGTYKALTTAVQQGIVPEWVLDRAVIRLFVARFQLGMFDPPADVPFRQIPITANNTPQNRALALKTAEESMVLLKNNGVLPLASQVKRIAVIGPTADSLGVLEGNYNGVAPDPVTLLAGIRARFHGAEIYYSQGSVFTTGGPAPVPESVLQHDGKQGLKAEYFDNSALKGKPVITREDSIIDFDWGHTTPSGIAAGVLRPGSFSVRWSGEFVPPIAGEYAFRFRARGQSAKVTLDGKAIADGRSVTKITFRDTRPRKLLIEYRHTGDNGIVGFDWEPPADAQYAGAVAAASKADVIVACIGLSPTLEGEENPVKADGFDRGDRTTIALPAVQQGLIDKLVATGKPLIVVVTSGSGIALGDAASHASAMIQAWYPGEAGGTAVAATLAGDSNPAGRLPMTFYRNDSDLPPFENYSMVDRTYRYHHGPVLYGFGYGLSYTSFRYSHLKLSSRTVKAGNQVTVTADVTNTGRVAGDEVAELYLTPPAAQLRPQIELEGFQRISLKPAETRSVSFQLDARQLSLVSPDGTRSDLPGNYRVSVGGSQPVAGSKAVSTSFVIEGTHALPK
jgi:beta-glucosidase